MKPDALRPCPFRKVLPTRHETRCDTLGCPCWHEVWMDRDDNLVDAGVRASLLNQALAADGWLHVIRRMAGGGASSEWLCPACAREMVDPLHHDVVEAQETQAHLARVWIRIESRWSAT